MTAGKEGPRGPDIVRNSKLAKFSDMSPADLPAEWRRLFRSNPPRNIGGDLMVLAIAWKIQVKVGFRIFGPDVRWYVVK